MSVSQAAHQSLPARGFRTTHWTVVQAAARNNAAAQQAREVLCSDYWYPIYAYLRRLGHKDAEDITQDFLTDILRRNWLAQADPHKGRFRSFLLKSLDFFLSDIADRRKALKRGGAWLRVPLDLHTATGEARYAQGRAESVSGVDVFEIEWATTMVTAALARLEGEYIANGKQGEFIALQSFLRETGDVVRYQLIATELEVARETVKSYVHRMRQRYVAILREEVARTVASPGEVDEEMRHLRCTLTLMQAV